MLWRIIANAEAGVYNDFESKLEMPKNELHRVLHQLGTPEALGIDEKMLAGDYDDDPFVSEK